MSVRVIDAVLDRSRSVGSARLVAVVLADLANHDGGGIWASTRWIATRARMDERTVRRALVALVELGELFVEHRPGRTNRYLIRVPEPVDNVVSAIHNPGQVARGGGHLAPQSVNYPTPTSGFKTLSGRAREAVS